LKRKSPASAHACQRQKGQAHKQASQGSGSEFCKTLQDSPSIKADMKKWLLFLIFLFYLPFAWFKTSRGLWKLFCAAHNKSLQGIKIWVEGRTA